MVAQRLRQFAPELIRSSSGRATNGGHNRRAIGEVQAHSGRTRLWTGVVYFPPDLYLIDPPVRYRPRDAPRCEDAQVA